MKYVRIAIPVVVLAFAGVGAADFQANPVPAIGQNAADQKAFDPAGKGPRILFIGNSITLHGPRPQIGWTNNWGMAASSRDKDYVHLLQKKIVAVRPDAQCCLLQVAGTFERSFFQPDWSCEKNFRWARAFRPDIIVMFFGANVPGTYDSGKMDPKPARTYGEALEAFRAYLDPDGKAVALISQGFYIRPKLDSEKEAVARKRARDIFVSMKDISSRADTHGRYNHPGDLGMQLIAERFWQHMGPLLAAFPPASARTSALAPYTLMVNEDNDHYFIQDSALMTREDLRAYVDSIAAGGKVSEIVFCPCGQPANWDSSAWEPIWKRLDDFPETYRKNPRWRTWPANLKLLHDKGIDPYQTWLERCREIGVGGWLSMRMNDVHFTTHKTMHVLRTVAFWRDHPELRRHPEWDSFAGGHDMHLRWKHFALDYSKPAAYAYSLAMAKELIERYAPDGLELDWMRYVTHLTPGKEREQANVLTSFMRDVRKIADAEGAKRGRRIALSARIPSRYDNARALGYDPETWAREGLCDLFIPCNKDSADFACDVADWKRRLAPARVIPGIDRFDCAGGEKVYPDLCGYLGWADAMRARGADGLYLFNAPYLPDEVKGAIWRDGLGVEVARRNSRRYIASYADSAPDDLEETDLPQMPWPLSSPRPLEVPLGNILPSDSVSVAMAFDAEPPEGMDVRLNGVRAAACSKIDSFGKAYGDPKRVKAGRRWSFPRSAIGDGGTAKVEVAAVAGCATKAMWCEVTAATSGDPSSRIAAARR